MRLAKSLTKTYVREYFHYSNGDLIRLRNKTRPDLIGTVAGTVRPDGYLKIRVNGSFFYAHRLVWIYHNGPIPDYYEIDHIDTNHGNNKIENLRCVKPFENNQNLRKARASNLSTGVLGVTINKRSTKKKYLVQIKKLDKKISKSFYTLDEARNFYIKTKRDFHEFSTL